MGVYRPDPVGFTELALGIEVARFIDDEAQRWADELRGESPKDPPEDEYANTITVHPSIVSVKGLERAAADIVANVPYASVLEVGSAHIKNPPRPLHLLLDRIQAEDPFRHKR